MPKFNRVRVIAAAAVIGGAVAASPAMAWTTVQEAKTVCVYDANGKASGQVSLTAGNREGQPAYSSSNDMNVEAFLDRKSLGNRLAAVNGKDAMWNVPVPATYMGGTAKFFLKWANGRPGTDTKFVSVPPVSSGCVDKTKPPTRPVVPTPPVTTTPTPTTPSTPAPPTVTVENPTFVGFSVRKDANLSSIVKGGNVFFTVTVKNTGSQSVRLRLVDTIPSGMVIFGKVPSGTSLKSGKLTANFKLAPGASKKVVYAVTTMRSGKLCNLVVVTTTGGLGRTAKSCVTVKVPQTRPVKPVTPVTG